MLERLKENTENITDDTLKELMQTVAEGLVPYSGKGNILTDDKAPVELLGMRVIDDIIQDELAYYKEKFKKDGISGIIGR